MVQSIEPGEVDSRLDELAKVQKMVRALSDGLRFIEQELTVIGAWLQAVDFRQRYYETEEGEEDED